MSDAWFAAGEGATELAPDDRDGLIPTYIATRVDLFEAEQRNIAKALIRRAPTTATLLDDKYLRDLHRAMFRDVWCSAGRYRTHETNIGIDPATISVAVRQLVDDTSAWVEHRTYDRDEIVVRFHHRLVQIHPFLNGNGRHGRVAADHLVASLGRPGFTWGRASAPIAEARAKYLAALRNADQGDIADLLAFTRS